MSGASSSSASVQLSAENLHLPPLRSLDDFVLGSARFQLPNMSDWEKWGNRVVKNLLYYQSNYFLMFIGIYALMIVVNPTKIICGLLVQAMLIAVFINNFSGKSDFALKAKSSIQATVADSQHKWLVLAGTLVFGYGLLFWFEAFLLSTFTLLLPFSLSFLHASLRLRNIRNKVANTMESFGPSTPMGVFLDAVGLSDGILS